VLLTVRAILAMNEGRCDLRATDADRERAVEVLKAELVP
jgi:hypothetical protein